MEGIISKELLSEVLCCRCTYVYNGLDEYSMLHYVDNNCECRLNIHELAHKCKQKAKEKGYYLKSWINDDDSGTCEILLFGRYDADTEPEAIFKAYQWALDNFNNKAQNEH